MRSHGTAHPECGKVTMNDVGMVGTFGSRAGALGRQRHTPESSALAIEANQNGCR